MFDSIQHHSFLGPPFLAASPVVLDLGANHGLFSKEMLQRFGGTYYLVEANPSLAHSLAGENLFHVWHCAVATSNGTIAFHLAENDTASSALTSSADQGGKDAFSQKIRVPARNIDSLLREISSERIDIVKIDIEGMETQVLLDLSSETLQKIGQITVEFHCDECFGFNLREEVKKSIRHLRANGFLCLNFSGTTMMDVLFINRRRYGIPRWKGRLWEMAGMRPTCFKKIKRFVPEGFRYRLNVIVNRLAGRKRESD